MLMNPRELSSVPDGGAKAFETEEVAPNHVVKLFMCEHSSVCLSSSPIGSKFCKKVALLTGSCCLSPFCFVATSS